MNSTGDILIIGSGIGSLSAACLLAEKGYKPILLEQNWLPGGCASSYPRKHFVFESGATTLVGLDEHMPLKYIFDKTGIKFNALKLNIPMKVYLKGGKIVTRFEELNPWIDESIRVFGKKGQEKFWKFCYGISQKVWKTSVQQTSFPPGNFNDLVKMALNTRLGQVELLRYAGMSMESLLEKYGLHENQLFREFVDEQLLITAQNKAPEVNVLFGATALCYTNYGNYYVNGGIIGLANAMVDYIKSKGGDVNLRHQVESIQKQDKKYLVRTRKQGNFTADYLISGIPINNTIELFSENSEKIRPRKLLGSKMLWSAFQMGIVFNRKENVDCIHHQIHLENPLPVIGSHSIFLSLSHPDDTERCGPDQTVASISTHIPDPENTFIENPEEVENAILDALEKHGFLKREDIIFQHSSGPRSWKKWTGREYGFVGGYPQFLSIKPWQMNDARLDNEGAYLCGDTAYPGQGIPGAALSGIIAAQKLLQDHG